jgi:hypothetical protein
MVRTLRRRVGELIACAIPAGLAHLVAMRVLSHASVTRFSDKPASKIQALDAIDWWEESKVNPRLARVRAVATTRIGPAVIAPRELATGEVLAIGEAPGAARSDNEPSSPPA